MSLHYHLIGIGGIGMSGIARLLLKRGIKVTGSDVKSNKNIEELQALGVEIFIGHNARNIKGADLIIYSSAIKEDNPEIKAAEPKSIPYIKRAQALAKLMVDKTVITISGSHGKTTTASLISFMLLKAGLSPTIAVGGIMRNIETNAYWGDGEFFVAEADESDGTFLYYLPKYSIITNVDREHLDYYKDFDTEVRTFAEFIESTREDGCLFCCNEDEVLKKILRDYRRKYVLFGLHEDAHVFPRNIVLKDLTSGFDCFYRGTLVDRFFLNLGGLHNVSNAMAVIALGLEMGIDKAVIKETLREFKGAGRRLEIRFKDENYLVLDDYAHHPTEIQATLRAVRNMKYKRIIAVFQPHRFSRTKLLLDEFGKCFDAADRVIVTDIYGASETPLEGINGESVCRKIVENAPEKTVEFVNRENIARHIFDIIKPGDLVITLGAGDITKTSEQIAAGLGSMSAGN